VSTGVTAGAVDEVADVPLDPEVALVVEAEDLVVEAGTVVVVAGAVTVVGVVSIGSLWATGVVESAGLVVPGVAITLVSDVVGVVSDAGTVVVVEPPDLVDGVVVGEVAVAPVVAGDVVVGDVVVGDVVVGVVPGAIVVAGAVAGVVELPDGTVVEVVDEAVEELVEDESPGEDAPVLGGVALPLVAGVCADGVCADATLSSIARTTLPTPPVMASGSRIAAAVLTGRRRRCFCDMRSCLSGCESRDGKK
jgi:hypothetical protein